MRVDPLTDRELRELERLELDYVEAKRRSDSTEILAHNEQETALLARLCDLARSERNWRAGQMLGRLLARIRRLEAGPE